MGDQRSGDPPMDIIVVGGSCAGLMTGILLRRSGHNVRILESAPTDERHGTGAGIGLAHGIKEFFDQEDALKDIRPMGAVEQFGFEIVGRELETRYRVAIKTNLTSWETVYYRLRANFDGYTSVFNPTAPPADSKDCSATFLTGKTVRKVEQTVNGRVRVFAEDARVAKVEEYESDVVVVADGTSSTIRRQLMPEVQYEVPGYVIWRGVVPTKDLSKETLAKIENRPLICPYKQTYMVIYTIPGQDGALEDGKRNINLGWYFWPQKDSLRDIMTDVNGHFHRTTLPPGSMRPEIWQRQLEFARQNFNPVLVSVLEKMSKPFVSIISSHTSPRAVHFNNRLFLVGDALAAIQPNTGLGTALGAFTVKTLVDKVLCPADGSSPLDPKNVREWETKVLQEIEVMRCRSVAFGSWYLNSWPKILYYFARYYFKLYWQYWFGGRALKQNAVGARVDVVKKKEA